MFTPFRFVYLHFIPMLFIILSSLKRGGWKGEVQDTGFLRCLRRSVDQCWAMFKVLVAKSKDNGANA